MFIRPRRAQSIVDFAVAFIAVAVLIVGIVRIWIWFNANYAKRQVSFQKSRLIAAGPERPYAASQAPVNIGRTSDCPDCVYKPLDLTEEWVFKGHASGTVRGTAGGEDPIMPGVLCDSQCKGECIGEPGCNGLEGFDTNCACYKSCVLKCNCKEQVGMMVSIYESQAISLNSQASGLRDNARSMRDTAEECDDPWEICWWGDWGKTPGELRDAASELDYSAKQLEHSAAKANQYAADAEACCGKTDADLQSQCFKDINVEANCDANCMSDARVFYDQCKADNPTWGQYICPFQADINYQACFTSCLSAQSASCGERVNSAISSLQSKIQNLNSTKGTYEGVVEDINNALSSCASNAMATCSSSCEDDPDPVSCYNQCYEAERDNCCQQNCCQGGSWGRSCDHPSTDCDDSCITTPCQKCGLSQAASGVNTKIQNITTQIGILQQKIQELPLCCDYESAEDQNSCIQSKYL